MGSSKHLYQLTRIKEQICDVEFAEEYIPGCFLSAVWYVTRTTVLAVSLDQLEKKKNLPGWQNLTYFATSSS